MGKSLSEVMNASAQSGKALDENLKKMQISHEKNLIAAFTAPTGKRAAENAKTKMQSDKTATLDKLKSDLKKQRENFKNSAKGVWADAASTKMDTISDRFKNI